MAAMVVVVGGTVTMGVVEGRVVTIGVVVGPADGGVESVTAGATNEGKKEREKD